MRNSIMRKSAVIALMTVIMIFAASEALAASSVSITGGDDVKGGETFTVKVSFQGDDIGRVNGSMTYDTDRLTYISGGSSSGNSGYIQLSEAGTGEDITFSIKFQAIADGFTKVDVSTDEVYDLDERELPEISGSKTINIVGSAAEGEKITEPAEDAADDQQAVTERRGVDEKPDDSSADTSGVTMILAISAAVAGILLIIVAAALKKSRQHRKH